MNADATTPERPPAPQKDTPAILKPAPRKSLQVGYWEFAKSIIMVVLVTKLSALAGYFAGKQLKVVERGGKKFYPLAIKTASITGAMGGFYEGWQRWRKTKGQELGVKDIHADLYKELDHQVLRAEVEQNQRIQDGIQILHTQGMEPRGTHSEAVRKENRERGSRNA